VAQTLTSFQKIEGYSDDVTLPMRAPRDKLSDVLSAPSVELPAVIYLAQGLYLLFAQVKNPQRFNGHLFINLVEYK
jgi:hypothetical protein